MTARPNMLLCPFCRLDARDGHHGSGVCNRDLGSIGFVTEAERAILRRNEMAKRQLARIENLPLCACKRARIYKGNALCGRCRREQHSEARRAARERKSALQRERRALARSAEAATGTAKAQAHEVADG